MQYFTHISNSYSCQNKLQKAILKYLIDQERLVVNDTALEVFKANVLASIEVINKENSKCKPINAYWWSGNDRNDYHLSLGACICNFNIHHSK